MCEKLKRLVFKNLRNSKFCLLIFAVSISLFVFVYFFSRSVFIKTYDTFFPILAFKFLRSVDVTLRYGHTTEP